MLPAVQQLPAGLVALVPVNAARATHRLGMLATPACLLANTRAGWARPGMAQQRAPVRTAGVCLAPLARLAAATGHEHRVRGRLRRLAAIALVDSQAILILEGLAKRAAEAFQLPADGDARRGLQLTITRFHLAVRPEADAWQVKDAIAAGAGPKLLSVTDRLGADNALVPAGEKVLGELARELRGGRHGA